MYSQRACVCVCVCKGWEHGARVSHRHGALAARHGPRHGGQVKYEQVVEALGGGPPAEHVQQSVLVRRRDVVRAPARRVAVCLRL